MVRLIFLSDIHGNLEALEATIKCIEAEGADKIFCLGDIVGYGADPEACREIVENSKWVTLLGNHDEAVLNPAGLSLMNPVARSALEWTRQKVSDNSLDWLRSLGMETQPFKGAVVSHALPIRAGDWLYSDDPRLVMETFRSRSESIVIVGHLHFAHAWHYIEETNTLNLIKTPDNLNLEEGKWLINVGSVGQPRDGDHRSCYVVMNVEEKTVTYKRVQYDTVLAAKKIVDEGLPEVLAHRLFLGQ